MPVLCTILIFSILTYLFIKMSFYNPAKIQELLTKKGLIDVVYNAIELNDNGNIVMAALEVLKKTKQLTDLPATAKSKKNAEIFRKMGEEATLCGQYSKAFSAYSQALLCSPVDSDAMISSYYDRTCLLFGLKAYTACLNDAKKCISMKPKHLLKNLKNMNEVCLEYKSLVDFFESTAGNQFPMDFFKFNQDKHPQVPCASTAVEITMQNGVPKVSAAKDILSGTLVALETAYIGHLNEDNGHFACCYCHKFSLNLIPCDSCCESLFCSVDCKERCWEEYHSVECHIIDVYDGAGPHPDLYALTIKAALKLKKACSWEEFIALSMNIGNIKNCSINEIFDVNNKASILNFINKRKLVTGLIFNASFNFANVLHQLGNVPSFYPENSKKKLEAKKALGNVLMTLFVTFPNKTEILNATQNIQSMTISTEPEENFGFFSFTSKLGHSCDPNLLVVGLNNKVALVALKSIKCGEELNISHIGHWYGHQYQDRRALALLRSQTTIMCRCRVCVESWDPTKNLRTADMSKQQKAAYKKWNKLRRNPALSNKAKVLFEETCRCLDLMSDLVHTKEHFEVFAEFRNLLSLFQYAATKNTTLQ